MAVVSSKILTLFQKQFNAKEVHLHGAMRKSYVQKQFPSTYSIDAKTKKG